METSVLGQRTGAGTEVLEAPKCRHEWMIDSPSGASSRGVCLTCGEERQFQNYIEGSAWGYDVSVEQLGGSVRLPVAAGAKGDLGFDEDE